MAQLNEYVLRIIFDYLDLETPLEWIQVSEVCQLWKLAATKQWRKIRTITYKCKEPEYESTNIPEITAKDAERIFKCAAPFVETLDTTECEVDKFHKDQLVEFGPFVYMVKDFNHEKVLKLIAEHADKLTEVQSREAPEPEVLQRLINGKTIKKFKFKQCNNFYEHVSTDDIEKLELEFLNRDEIIRPFNGHFPNLKDLKITLTADPLFSGVELKLTPILPYVLGLTSINIELWPFISPSNIYSVSYESLMGLTKLLQLEELNLLFYQTNVTGLDSFITKLAKGCPKFKSVSLIGLQFTEIHICTLLSLPHLDYLHLDKVMSFRSIELSKMSNLTKLYMSYDWVTFDIRSFCNALRKMPKLELLEMDVRSRNAQSAFEFVCQVILVVVSQNKDVFVSDRYVTDGWKIERKNAKSLNTATLNIELSTTLIFSKYIKTFLQNNLVGYTVVEKPKECWDSD